MNIQTIIFISVIVLYGIYTIIDLIKCFRSKKMVDDAINNCIKAIKEKEVK